MDKFNSRHFGFLFLATAIVPLKTYPKVFTNNGGRDSWISVIISSIIILMYLVAIIQICKKKNSYDFVRIYRAAVGERLGNLLLWLFCLTLFLTLVESAAIEASSMHTNMLQETPIWFFLLLFVFPAAYTVGRDLVAILTVTLIGITLIIFAGINLAILTVEYKETRLLFPIFENGITNGFILSILQTLGLYGSITIILPYLSLIKNKAKLLRDSVIGLLFVIQMQIVAITGVLMSFDLERVNSMPYPKLLQTQLVSHFRFMEAGEIYVMLQIVGGWYIRYVVAFYALIKVLSALNLRHKYHILIITSLVGISAYFAGTNLFRLFMLLDIYTYICFINFFVIPAIVFIVYSMKSQGVKSEV